MDIGILRGLGTILVFAAFIGVVAWAYNSKRQCAFNEAANLPFADDPEPISHNQQVSRSNQE
ncbi:cbb3-type cytochrome oxidase subunit 3 [Pseudomonas sp. B392_1p]|jgi:cytochrome c oxidase cbb3-type subunit 4|uniref:cbb3-type cytochrome oxidase subunit 3 n=1 Tax=Pseudomonas sp. B392_1p TaxID=3457507 RepID=UPI003FD0DEFF